MRTLLVGLTILIGLWAVPASAQPAAVAAAKTVKRPTAGSSDPLHFTSFHRTRELLSDPYEFASDEARILLEHIVRYSKGRSANFEELLKEGGEYAALGGNCFLVNFGMIQHACLDSPIVEELTAWALAGDTEFVETHALAGARWWALVKREHLSYGAVTQTYYALVGSLRSGKSVVTSKPLASESAAMVDEDRCDMAIRPAATAESKIDSFKVERHAGGASVVFRIERWDCRTGRAERVTRRYRIPGTEARPKP